MSTIADLKRAILNKNLNDSLLVLCCKDVFFVAQQYVNAIADFKELQISYCDDFDEQFMDFQNNMFDFSDIDYLKIFHVDKFSTKLSNDLTSIKNAVVICKSVDEKLLKILKDNDMYFEIPKLQEWQIVSYCTTMCEGLTDAKIKWLCKMTNNDIYRLDNEMRKISCFDKKQQDDIFDLIDSDNGYSDLSDVSIYNLTNAICERNYKAILEILKDIDNLDTNPYGIVTLLKRSFKSIIGIQMDSNATAEKLGIKPVQFNIMKSKNCNKFTDERLREIYKFLTDYDYLLKSGQLDMPEEMLVDYIICTVLS